jgi:hypothetical protein
MPKPIIPFWSSDETKSPLLLKEDDVILENNSAEKLPEPTRGYFINLTKIRSF